MEFLHSIRWYRAMVPVLGRVLGQQSVVGIPQNPDRSLDTMCIHQPFRTSSPHRLIRNMTRFEASFQYNILGLD